MVRRLVPKQCAVALNKRLVWKRVWLCWGTCSEAACRCQPIVSSPRRWERVPCSCCWMTATTACRCVSVLKAPVWWLCLFATVWINVNVPPKLLTTGLFFLLLFFFSKKPKTIIVFFLSCYSLIPTFYKTCVYYYREFHIAQSLRGSAFEECLRLYRAQHDFLSSDACQAAASTSGARVGILTVGATAPGMATAIAGVARLLLSRGARPLGFRRGFLGLVSATQPIEYDWFSLRDLIASGLYRFHSSICLFFWLFVFLKFWKI